MKTKNDVIGLDRTCGARRVIIFVPGSRPYLWIGEGSAGQERFLTAFAPTEGPLVAFCRNLADRLGFRLVAKKQSTP